MCVPSFHGSDWSRFAAKVQIYLNIYIYIFLSFYRDKDCIYFIISFSFTVTLGSALEKEMEEHWTSFFLQLHTAPRMLSIYNDRRILQDGHRLGGRFPTWNSYLLLSLVALCANVYEEAFSLFSFLDPFLVPHVPLNVFSLCSLADRISQTVFPECIVI